MAIKINELLPTESSFKLSLARTKEFKLRPCTIGLLAEMNELIGNVESMLSTVSLEGVCKIALFLMNHDDALFFKKQTVKFVDVITGDEKEKSTGGYKLLMSLVKNVNEHCDIYSSVLDSLGHDKEKTKEIIKKFIDSLNGVINKSIDEDIKKKSLNH